MNFEIFEEFMLWRNFWVIVDNKIEPLIKFSSDFAMLLQSQFYIKLVYKATLSFKVRIIWEGLKISTLLLSIVLKDKSKVEISQNFAAFSEYTNFK